MAKTMNVILGLAFLALGILGITGLVPMFKTDVVYVNIGEIVLGGLGFLVGIYARQNTASNYQSRENARQRKDISDQRKESYNQKTKENEQLRKENSDQLKDKNDLQRKDNEQQRKANEQQRKENNSQ
jgi:hypothetical protein